MEYNYNDLSDDDDESSFSYDDDKHHYGDIDKEESEDLLFFKESTTTTTSSSLISRQIIHCDIDCFYCQCEYLINNPSLRDRPFAIGQKHIIVTCNYVARGIGVKKLMSKTEALRVCPSLVIVDGSDLTLYRQQSRRVYKAFRQAILNIGKDRHLLVAKKGGFDEMYADITLLVQALVVQKEGKLFNTSKNTTYIYGNSKDATYMTEDQSGATVCVKLDSSLLNSPTDGFGKKESIENWGNMEERRKAVEYFKIASWVASNIQKNIKDSTGFTVCLGVSANPMLAKLASDLKKPFSVNVLYPWRSYPLINDMPLRKISGLGSKTLKRLQPILEKYCKLDGFEREVWKCSDLLQVPNSSLDASGLGDLSHYKAMCQGVDTSVIDDDEGGIPKIVSLENSHRQGTVTAISKLQFSLQSLCDRLPDLIGSRMEESQHPMLSFPRTIRVSVCDASVARRKRKSKQSSFDGSVFLKSSNDNSSVLFTTLWPMLLSLLELDESFPSKRTINVTHLNIGVLNFADLEENRCGSKGCNTLKRAFEKQSEKRSLPQSSSSMLSTKNKTCIEKEIRRRHDDNNHGSLDPEVLSQLPQDIIEEVLRDERLRLQNTKSINRGKKEKLPKQTTLNSFFKKTKH